MYKQSQRNLLTKDGIQNYSEEKLLKPKTIMHPHYGTQDNIYKRENFFLFSLLQSTTPFLHTSLCIATLIKDITFG
jgi:hypothetical protein